MRYFAFLLFAGMAFAQVQRTRTVVWEDPNPPGTVTEYRLSYGTVKGGPYDMGTIVIPAGTLQGSVTLPKGTYYFVCRCVNPDSVSEPSNEAQTTVYDNAMKPLNLIIKVGP